MPKYWTRVEDQEKDLREKAEAEAKETMRKMSVRRLTARRFFTILGYSRFEIEDGFKWYNKRETTCITFFKSTRSITITSQLGVSLSVFEHLAIHKQFQELRYLPKITLNFGDEEKK